MNDLRCGIGGGGGKEKCVLFLTLGLLAARRTMAQKVEWREKYCEAEIKHPKEKEGCGERRRRRGGVIEGGGGIRRDQVWAVVGEGEKEREGAGGIFPIISSSPSPSLVPPSLEGCCSPLHPSQERV